MYDSSWCLDLPNQKKLIQLLLCWNGIAQHSNVERKKPNKTKEEQIEKQRKKERWKRNSWQTTERCDNKGSSPLWCDAGSGAVCEVTRVAHSYIKARIECYDLEDMLWVETEATGQASLACIRNDYCNDPVWL